MKNKISKSIIYGVAAIIVLIFVFFESSVLNVKAQVDGNFLIKLSTFEINFGTVFPQEKLNKELTVSFDDSFYQLNQGDRVVYKLKEQLKLLPTGGGYYPDLCQFLDEEVDNIPSDSLKPEFLTLVSDESDIVKAKLTVPCFEGECELGYAGPILAQSLKGKIFGCDLWIEVMDVFFVDQVAGLWYFNEGTGNFAYDTSGNGNHGTLINNPTWMPGTHLSFDGANDYVDVPGIANNPSVITQEVWIKTTFPGGPWGWNVIMTKRHVDDGSDWATLTIYNGHAVIQVDDRGYAADIHEGTTQVNDGNWHQIVGVKDGCNYLIYVDGKLENSFVDCYPLGGSPYNLHIGHHGAWGNFFNGAIDSVRVYYRALNPSEIQQHFLEGRR